MGLIAASPRRVVFLATGFPAADFFFTTDFFLAAGFFVAGFFGAVFFAVFFLAEAVFMAADFFRVCFFLLTVFFLRAGFFLAMKKVYQTLRQSIACLRIPSQCHPAHTLPCCYRHGTFAGILQKNGGIFSETSRGIHAHPQRPGRKFARQRKGRSYGPVSRITTSRMGPCAPWTSIFSMSAVRLEPLITQA